MPNDYWLTKSPQTIRPRLIRLRVCASSRKLRRLLSTLVGSSGFRSLLARALTLAKAQDPRLSVAQIKPDGSLEGLSDLGKQDQATEVILIAQLFGLLVTFIGESLTLSLLLDAWPDLPVFETLEKSDHDPTR